MCSSRRFTLASLSLTPEPSMLYGPITVYSGSLNSENACFQEVERRR
jgi:hypothetical protein